MYRFVNYLNFPYDEETKFAFTLEIHSSFVILRRFVNDHCNGARARTWRI